MGFDLKGKVTVITGGAMGIGFEITCKFLEKGATVVIIDINEVRGVESTTTLKSKFGEDRAFFFKGDVVSDLESIYKATIYRFKAVDILVNNAAIFSDSDIKKTVDVNLTAVIEWSYKFWEHMRTDKGGKGGTIINLDSIYGYRVDPFLTIYQATKFAVMGFTKSLGHVYNYNRTNVRVLAICPGFTQTKLTTELIVVWKDTKLQEDFTKFMNTQVFQNVEAVGKAAVEIYEIKDSGTAWLIEGAKSLVEV